MTNTSQDRIRTLLRFGVYGACAVLSVVAVRNTAFGLGMILPGGEGIAWLVALVLQLIIVSSSWLFFSRLTGRIDRDGSVFRGAGLLATTLTMWLLGASFSTAGSYLAIDHRLSTHRSDELAAEHQAAALRFNSKVAGQIAERATFAKARLDRLAHLRDDERTGRISGQAGCSTLCLGLTDRVARLEGLMADIDRVGADLQRCAIDDVRCAQTALDRVAGVEPALAQALTETADFLGPWKGLRHLPEDWSRLSFSAAPALPSLRTAEPARLAGVHDLLSLRPESVYAAVASVAIELLLAAIACLGVLLVPLTPTAKAEARLAETPAVAATPSPPDPQTEPGLAPIPQANPPTPKPRAPTVTRAGYSEPQKNRLIHIAAQLKKDGRTVKETAEMLSVSPSTLSRWLKKPPPKKSNLLVLEPSAETSRWLGALAKRLHDNGASVAVVAKTLGVNQQAARDLLEIADEAETDPALGDLIELKSS